MHFAVLPIYTCFTSCLNIFELMIWHLSYITESKGSIINTIHLFAINAWAHTGSVIELWCAHKWMCINFHGSWISREGIPIPLFWLILPTAWPTESGHRGALHASPEDKTLLNFAQFRKGGSRMQIFGNGRR